MAGRPQDSAEKGAEKAREPPVVPCHRRAPGDRQRCARTSPSRQGGFEQRGGEGAGR